MNRRIGNMSWPAPGDQMDDLEWRLRYGWVSKDDFLGAAAIISAYRQLIFDKKDKRKMVVRELRKGPYRPEKPCPNCHWTAEWQVAEPGGIGCGGTGGPL